MTTSTPDLPAAHPKHGSQSGSGGGDQHIPAAQAAADSHSVRGSRDQASRPPMTTSAAIEGAAGGCNPPPPNQQADAKAAPAVGAAADHPASTAVSTAKHAAVLDDPLLRFAADILDDLEQVRVANENRLRQLTRPAGQTDADGGLRGFGYTTAHPDVARLAALVAALKTAEHDAELNLRRHMRAHPLGPWAAGIRNIGEKQAARLLAATGDPCIRPEIAYDDGHTEPSRPRTVRELYALCGYAPGQQRLHGIKAKWNHDAKKRAWLIASKTVLGLHAPCTKPEGSEYAKHLDGCACSPYRLVYDEARERYQDRAHTGPCVRCGPSGAPAQPGSPWSLGHKKAAAVRIVAKRILRDLWRESRRLHGITDPPAAHGATDSQGRCGGGGQT